MNKPTLYIIDFNAIDCGREVREWDIYVTEEKPPNEVAKEYTDFFKEEYERDITNATAYPQKKWGTYRIQLVNEMNID